MNVVQQESFGPVLTVETFDGDTPTELEDAAVAVANDTPYGLAGAVWTDDFHPYVPRAEWGGHEQSGVGRELGLAGLAEHRETKHVWHSTNPARSGWFDRGER